MVDPISELAGQELPGANLLPRERRSLRQLTGRFAIPRQKALWLLNGENTVRRAMTVLGADGERIRVHYVDKPPFSGMRALSLFDDIYYNPNASDITSFLYPHETWHYYQYRKTGFFRWAVVYTIAVIRYGLAGSPFEIEADLPISGMTSLYMDHSFGVSEEDFARKLRFYIEPLLPQMRSLYQRSGYHPRHLDALQSRLQKLPR